MKKNEEWDVILSKMMNPQFTESQFNKYFKRHEEKLGFYKKWIKGDKILDIGCGFGYTSIPLSALGYDVVALDNNPVVVERIRKNAKRFGKRIKIINGDIFKINKLFEEDSFDASISSGLLEHFSIGEIREILRKQLKVAPVVIADIPIHSDKSTLKNRYSDFRNKICKDGVYRNLWCEDYWVNTVLKNFRIDYHKVSISSKNTGSFEKLTLVIKRK